MIAQNVELIKSEQYKEVVPKAIGSPDEDKLELIKTKYLGMIKQLEKIQMANRQMACCEISKMPRDSDIDIGNFYAFISCGASPMFSKRIDA